MLSMMLQSKILKTKKRLFDNPWNTPCLIISCMGLFTILSFAMRATSVTWNFGLVKSYLPIIEQPFNDLSAQVYKYPQQESLTAQTLAILINDNASYFGELTAFTTEYHDVRNKFIIPHYQGAPQIHNLIDNIEKWQKDSAKFDQTVLLFVAPDWPMAIVIQIIHYLNESNLFDQVILGGGYIP